MIDRRTIAYHEAGHAAMLFFLGQWTDLYGITMNPKKTDRAAAFVTMKKWGATADELQKYANHSTESARVLVNQKLMTLFAGPCAENRITVGDRDWGYGLLVYRHRKGSDAEQIYTLARIAEDCRPSLRLSYWTLIGRLSRWTEEALRCRRMWRVVKALADRLQHTDEMSGGEALNIMFTTYGRNNTAPPVTTISKWRKRFPCLVWSEIPSYHAIPA